MEAHKVVPASSLEAVRAADYQARSLAGQEIAALAVDPHDAPQLLV
jgi:hypothetical protein